MTVHATVQGSFSAATRASGRQEADVTCTGTQCTSFGGGTLPCHFAVDFVIQAF